MGVFGGSNQYPGVKPSDTKETTLVEQTRRAILEAQSSRSNNISANKESHDLKRTNNALNHDSQVAPSGVQMEKWTTNNGSVESKNNERGPFTVDQTSKYDQLSGNAGSIDHCSKANMDRLVQIGEELLKRNVCQVDLETGRNVEVPRDGTNSEQLAKFARQLSDKRRRRKKELQFN